MLVYNRKKHVTWERAVNKTPNDSKEHTRNRSGRSFFKSILERKELVVSPADKKRRKLMRKFRRAKHIPSETEVERFTPPLDKGLSADQVELRFNQFLFNDVNKRYSKTYTSIFVGNICTFFNLLCVLVAVALALANAPLSQFLFVAIFAVNLTIGIIQEILAKRQIDKLSLLVSSTANVIRGGVQIEIPIREIVLDDVLCLEVGQQIPADCIIAEGSAEVNESLLTGESASVKKAEGDSLYAGSYIVSGSCLARAEKVGHSSYLNNLASKAKKYKRPSSEILNSIRLFIRAIGGLIIPIAALMFLSNWRGVSANPDLDTWTKISQCIQYTGAVIIGMIPSGLLLLTSVAMAMGMWRLSRKQTLVQDMYSLEMLARVNVLCLDKTGTITDGRMTVSDCMILNNETDLSIDDIMGSMLMALDDNNHTSIALRDRFGHSNLLQATEILPFSSARKFSAVTFGEDGTYAFGAPEFILRPLPQRIERISKQYAQMGLRVLLLAGGPGKLNGGDKLPAGMRAIALITLADNIRPEAIETIKWFKDNQVDIRIISGDNPVTVSEVARRVGVRDANKFISLDGLTDIEVENVANQYTVFGRVTPEQKAILVKTLKREGNTVAMTGDGVNDILALKEADCAISIASGSEAARNVSHLVLINNNFMNLPSVVEEGRRVINNIKNSASLYIMKTLFTMLLAVICMLLPNQQYFFTTNNLILFEFFVAAVPSLFISLQPNKERVRGQFIPYVLSRSIPGAITLILCVLAVYFGNLNLTDEVLIPLLDAAGNPLLTESGEVMGTIQTVVGFGVNFKPMLIMAVTFGGIVMLYRILKPLNLIRTVLYLSCFAICIVVICVPPLGNIIYNETASGGYCWADINFTVMQVLYIICIMLAAFPVSGFLVKACDLLNPD